MVTATTYARYGVLEPGAYRVRVCKWYILDTPFGRRVVIRFDRPTKKGVRRRRFEVSVEADLTGGERPSPLYSWISALEFGGEALPEGYSLEKANLLLRKAWAVIDVFERHGAYYNRLVRLSPLRSADRGDGIDSKTKEKGQWAP